MNKENILLAIINEAGERGLTPVKLQKSLFLIDKAFPDLTREFYNFIPYNYGPFDKEVYSDAELLIDSGLVLKEESHGLRIYKISEDGVSAANKIMEEAPTEFVNYLQKMINWIQPLSFQVLISSVYAKYPDYKVNSIFQEQV